ncbi:MULTISPECIES: hypothetical protein [Limosilactobacillus]|uniref:Uncharacterized protein n=2 Tax=Limosilactobacillus TaxID=2742598 RepID=A0A317GIX2_LIMRT|nr:MULTISPECIES: hypothetical protein [Limosilactobacillus]MBB1110621.1 hypothetical protein [Limosilactobacillus balticus]MBB1127895.1 hypothetical protein [Limosilactobacillus balticus]MCD7136595.1 hypothetical protein [Limosilactobacillus balticus]MCD7138512.1 hypothetical protein [Limosilactobacillus balticus]MCH5384513.1 hypothetical protein [Limosilactobacillus reuteri]
MFDVIFWILAIWFVVNVVWMWFALNNQILQKTFAWINVCAIVIGFWVYYGMTHDGNALNGWFLTMNWVNIAIAAIQFYFGYRENSVTHNGHTTA